jgi:MoxR-like ATPase
VSYPTKDQELEVMRRMANLEFNPEVEQLLQVDEIKAISHDINTVTMSEILERYIIELIFATRRPADYDMAEAGHYIQFGASPRASINLNRAAKANAYFAGRDFVLPEDIKDVANDVLNHRLILNYEAEADGVTSSQIIETLLQKVAIDKG